MQVWGRGSDSQHPQRKLSMVVPTLDKAGGPLELAGQPPWQGKKIRTQFNAKPCVKEIRWSGGGVIHL